MPALPPWPIVQSLLLTLILPAGGVAGGVFAVVGMLPRWRSVAASVALMAGLIAGNVGRKLLPFWSLEAGWPSLLPGASLALIATAVACLIAERGQHRVAGIIRCAAFGIVAWWLTPDDLPIGRVAAAILLWAVLCASVELLERIWHQVFPRIGTVLYGMLFGWAAATVLIYAHSARFSDLAVLMAAALVGIGLIAAWRKTSSASAAAGPAIYFPVLMLAGATNTYSEVPVASFFLVGLAPLGLALLWIPVVQRLSPVRRAAVTLGTLLAPLIVAVVLAVSHESLEFG